VFLSVCACVCVCVRGRVSAFYNPIVINVFLRTSVLHVRSYLRSNAKCASVVLNQDLNRLVKITSSSCVIVITRKEWFLLVTCKP
jgi:hypothetical protein